MCTGRYHGMVWYWNCLRSPAPSPSSLPPHRPRAHICITFKNITSNHTCVLKYLSAMAPRTSCKSYTFQPNLLKALAAPADIRATKFQFKYICPGFVAEYRYIQNKQIPRFLLMSTRVKPIRGGSCIHAQPGMYSSINEAAFMLGINVFVSVDEVTLVCRCTPTHIVTLLLCLSLALSQYSYCVNTRIYG